jgi:hypothetical protein
MSLLMVRGFAGMVKLRWGNLEPKGTGEGTLLLSDLGLTNVRQEAGMGSAASGIVRPGFVEAESSVDGEADIGGIFIFLAVVFPPAHRAKCKRARRFQRLVTAAGTTKSEVHHSLHRK